MVAYDDSGNLVAGFQLFAESGMVSFLEGFPFGLHEWPSTNIEPVYVYQTDGRQVCEDDVRFPQIVSKYRYPEEVVTKAMLDAVGGMPLPGWPLLCADI